MREIIDLTTPALLFPAISLLMLAYTNHFITLARLVRELHAEYQQKLTNLLDKFTIEKRIAIIKYMRIFDALSFFLCGKYFLIFAGNGVLASTYWLEPAPAVGIASCSSMNCTYQLTLEYTIEGF